MSVDYDCQTLTQVTQIWPDNQVNLAIRVYLPFPPAELSSQVHGKHKPAQPLVQVKLGRGRWQSLTPPTAKESSYWELTVERVSPGIALRFRYLDEQGHWQPIAPFTHLERVDEVSYIPQLNYQWIHNLPVYNHAQVVIETTLEGLVAGYEGGVFAPRSREEMFLNPIARQIMRTTIPSQLAALGVDAVMVATNSSVADRSCLNPPYNYLAYDVADFHWQLGGTQDIFQLIDAFHGVGLSLIPDLAFVHQVRTPFAGSLDQVQWHTAASGSEQFPFLDDDAYAFRDYGTWMFRLDDPEIRRQLVEKIVAFAVRYRCNVIRLGYLDGLIYQYSKRDTNYGERFLQELKAECKRVLPNLQILGEIFAVQDHPMIKDCIDIFYAPCGFPVAEALYKQPAQRKRPLYPDFDVLMSAIAHGIASQRQNAIYAQLHDEISDGETDHQRANPAELARRQGENLIAMGQLPPEDLLDYTRRLVRNTEAITLFMSKLMYMFVPAVDSLILGSLDSPGNWKFHWDSVSPEQLNFWKPRGLSDRQIYLLHKQHRQDMARLRQIFRSYTPVDPDSKLPLTDIQLDYTDPEHGVFGLWRSIPERLYETLLVLFNLGPVAFKDQANDEKSDRLRPTYSVPIPWEFQGQWEVLLDGDWIDPLLRTRDRQHYIDTNEELTAYDPGTILHTQSLSPQADTQTDRVWKKTFLPLNLGAFNLVILKFKRQLDLPT